MLASAAQTNEEFLQAALDRLGPKCGSDPELRRSAPRPEVIAALHGEELSAVDVLAQACAAYADRPALGERVRILDRTGPEPVLRPQAAFRTLAYGELWRRTVDLATGLVRDPRTALRPSEIVGIYGFGSVEYVVADMACLYAGLPSAMLQMGMPPGDLRQVVAEAELACIICTADSFTEVRAAVAGCGSLRAFVLIDAPVGSATGPARPALPVLTLAELEAAGRAAPHLAPFRPAPGTDPLATLMYTSGSTGLPKGAMMTRRLWRSHWQLHGFSRFARFPNITLGFYPLSHLLGRHSLVRTLVLGGVTHFTLNSDLSTLFEDIRLVRPTFLTLVPRVSEQIHEAFQAGRPRRPEEGGAKGQDFLGDRLTALFIGSAPTAPELAEFLQRTFEVPVYEGYGSTEAGIISLDGEIVRPLVTDHKLVDVPELGYLGSDRPHPRGELRVKTCQTIPGFFHNPEATRKLYDEDGFLCTGDIMEATAPGRLRWIDRRGNVVKLAQGEYITLWRLEAAFSSGSPLLDQVYLYANSLRAYPLAVVVPAWAAVRARLGRDDPDPGAVRQLLRGELGRVAQAAGLRPYEVPRDLLVEPEPWTRENGFLTGINKPARPQLKQRYGPRLEDLYRSLETGREQARADLGRPGEDLPPAERARRAMAAVLGLPDLDPAAGSFRDFGGDSLAALDLSALLEETCGVPVPVAALLDPGNPLQAVIRRIGAPAAAAQVDCAAIHGRDATVLRAADLRLERFLDRAEWAPAAGPGPGPVRTVLLTGANGFLGHTLCLAWMERLAAVGGRVRALVRAADPAAARARLDAAFHTGDPALEARYATLAAHHLEVLAGDLAAPELGLPAADYTRLAEGVDLIVHPGALVNHVFSYAQLFGPNVLGTVQLLRLTRHGRPKRLDYVSTLGVLAGVRTPGPVLESAGVAALGGEWPAAGGYAHGYAASKWACEWLVRDLAERFGTPVRVFRPGMILPRRHGRGQANGPDLLSRLLISLIRTGLAPASFHAGGRGSGRPYDGLPVDFVAESMVELSSAHHEGLATYHVSQGGPGPGASLDTLVDWVETAGYPLERMESYGDWFRAFRTRLEALPAVERQASAWPILQHWAEPMAAPTAWPDCRLFLRDLDRPDSGGGTGLPCLDQRYLHKYLADLRELGLLA